MNAVSSLALPPMQGALYVYTDPLAQSTCKLGGQLKQLNFCYLAQLSNATEDSNEAVFTIALIEDNGFGYTARFVHEEREDRGFCLKDYDTSSCCKWVTVNPPLEMKSSYALAVLTSSEVADNGFIYVVGNFAPGFIADDIDAIVEESQVENLERSDAFPIPQLALTLVLETGVSIEHSKLRGFVFVCCLFY